MLFQSAISNLQSEIPVNLSFAMMIGLKEIWAHKFRSFLTMLGVILGVASLLSMFSLTAGIAKGCANT